MSFSFLLMISRSPRNSRSLEKVADCVKRSRASSISLRSVWRSFSSEWMRASSSELRASASFTRRRRRAGRTPSASTAPAGRRSPCRRTRRRRARAAPPRQHRHRRGHRGRRGSTSLGPQRLAGAIDSIAAIVLGRHRLDSSQPLLRGPCSQPRFGGRSSSDHRLRRSTMSLLCDDASGDPASSAANAACVSGSNFSPSNGDRPAVSLDGLLRRVAGNAVAAISVSLLVVVAARR